MTTQMIIQQQTRELMDKAQIIVREAKEIVVQDKDGLTAAVDFLGRIAMAKKEVDSRRRFFVDPLNQQVKSINDLFRKYNEPLVEADKIVRNKVLAYQAEEARRVAEEQQRGMSPYTVQAKVRALKAFSSWLLSEGCALENLLKNIKLRKVPIKVVDTLTPDEIKALVDTQKPLNLTRIS